MKHTLFDYRRKIDRTHKGLGNLSVACLLACKARKAAIVAAVSGTGKTTAIRWAARQVPHGRIELDSITRSGLKSFEDELNGFSGVFTVNDLGAVDTAYSVRESCKVIALLSHEHGLSKKNVSMDLSISGYYGSALSTIQPASMNALVSGTEWDSVLQDKTTRYYHLTRPTAVNHAEIDLSVKWGPELEYVKATKDVNAHIVKYVKAEIQPWSDARAMAHWLDYAKAAAALAGRKAVLVSDFAAVKEILRPVNLESYLVWRESLSTQRSYLANDHCILTELATYGELSHKRTVKNYRISSRTLQRTLDTAGTWLIPGPRGSNKHLPSQQALDVFSECGYHVEV